MGGSSTLYFQFKPYLGKRSSETVYLKDILELTGPSPLIENVGEYPIFPKGIQASVRVNAMQVIRVIGDIAPDMDIQALGDTAALFEPVTANNANPFFTFIKVIAASILLFIGSGLAIMYFHADVNMHEAHQMVYYLISGERVERPVLLSVSYSIGIGLGIALFFDVFTLGRKKGNPGPLELEMYQNEKELEDYLVHLEGKKEES